MALCRPELAEREPQRNKVRRLGLATLRRGEMVMRCRMFAVADDRRGYGIGTRPDRAGLWRNLVACAFRGANDAILPTGPIGPLRARRVARPSACNQMRGSLL